MSQPYRCGYEPFNRSLSHQAMSTTSPYGRHNPYGYNEQPHRDPGTEYTGVRQSSRSMIQGPDPPPGNNEAPRKRISLACSRCRRRKIKCSGDPGDGGGCSACKTSGADASQCFFIRVGANPVEYLNMDLRHPSTGMNEQSQTPQPSAGCGMEPSSTSSTYNTGTYHPGHHRQSLQALPTRSAFPAEQDSQYDVLPMGTYPFTSAPGPRQSFIVGNSSPENYRAWSNTGNMLSGPASSIFYDMPQSSQYGLASLPSTPYAPTQLPAPQQQGRLPSLVAENFSTLNLSSMNPSLPMQTVSTRRLPAPCTTQMTQPEQFGVPETPGMRPLGSLGEMRLPSSSWNGYGRGAPSWSSEDIALGPSRNASLTSQLPVSSNAYPTAGHLSHGSSSLAGPLECCQFHASAPPATVPSSGSEVADAPAGTLSSSFSSASSSSDTAQLSASAFDLRYSSLPSQQGYGLPSHDSRPASSRSPRDGPSS